MIYGNRRQEEARKERLFTTLLIIAAFLIAGSILLFNRNGFMATTEMEKRTESVKTANEAISLEIDSLQTVILLLENDSLHMEKRVREILGWGREGEFIIRLMEPEN